MPKYDLSELLSPLDFEVLIKDLLECELKLPLENFKEGKDGGIDLRHASITGESTIIQCKRFRQGSFSELKRVIVGEELPKIRLLKPAKYILATSVNLSPQQAVCLKELLSPYVKSTGDIYGGDRINELLRKHAQVEKRHIKLWMSSTNILEAIIHSRTHQVSKEEIENCLRSARLYVKNESFDEALKILKKNRICIITGIPGIGKTTLARLLMIFYYRRKYDIIKIENDISEARLSSSDGRPKLYYYDDFLGQTGRSDKLNKNEDQKILDFIKSIRSSKHSLFILTTREYILNQAKELYEKFSRTDFRADTCIIDLSKYTRRARAHILYNHLHFSELPNEHLDYIIDNQLYLKIIDHPNYNPRLIELLTSPSTIGSNSPKQFSKLFLDNFNNPHQVWKHAFENQISKSSQHLLVVLASLPTNVSKTEISQAFNLFHQAQCLALSLPRSHHDFTKALKEVDGSFISIHNADHSDDLYVKFQNPSIRDFMKSILIEDSYLEEVIKSLFYFEQAQVICEFILERQSQLEKASFKRLRETGFNTLVNLIDKQCCSSESFGGDFYNYLYEPRRNPFARIKYVAEFWAKMTNELNSFVINYLTTLTQILKKFNPSPRQGVRIIRTLKKLGYLKTPQGKAFLEPIAEWLTSADEIGDYEIVATTLKEVPGILSRTDVRRLSVRFEQYVGIYCRDCDYDDPEHLRGEAIRVEEIGQELAVNTLKFEKDLKERAEAKEKKAEEEDSSTTEGESISTESVRDSELCSIFGTLRKRRS